MSAPSRCFIFTLLGISYLHSATGDSMSVFDDFSAGFLYVKQYPHDVKPAISSRGRLICQKTNYIVLDRIVPIRTLAEKKMANKK